MKIKPKCELHNKPLEGALAVVPNDNTPIDPEMGAVEDGWTLDTSFMYCPDYTEENNCNQVWSFGIEDM